MHIFEYPYIIITVLVICFGILCVFGVYYALKCIKNANGTNELDFSSVSGIETEYQKPVNRRKEKCLVYVHVALDSMSRIYSESKAMIILSEIKKLLLSAFNVDEISGVANYGNNSFIALNGWSRDEAKDNIEKTAARINQLFMNNEVVNIAKIHIGFYCTKSTEVNFKTAVTRAKQACTIAEDKDVSYYEWDNNNGKQFEKKIKIENSVLSEIENNRFFLVYQPLIDAATGKIIGAEVLSRLNSENDGVITPGTFLSAVNSVGLTQKFDYYIFEKNCKWISNNKQQREEYFYTINFSRSTMCDEKFADNIIGIVEKYGLKFSTLAIEILEDKNLSEIEKSRMVSNISALKQKGILILLDDFGSGYTSFADLKKFDIHTVKIDKELIKNAVDDSGFVILKNIINTAKELGFKTLCEGIETQQHVDIAKKAGCDMMQGYFFYRPLGVAVLEQLFENNK